MTEAAFLEDAHERSLSSDPVEACRGRLDKVFQPVIATWAAEERHVRCTGRDTLLNAVAVTCGTTVSALAELLTRDDAELVCVLEQLRELFNEGFTRQIEATRMRPDTEGTE